MKKIGTRALSIVISILMVIYLVPLSVYASFSEYLSDKENRDIAQEPSGIIRDVFEVTDRREETVKHFRLEDGSYTAVQYDVPVHYMDEDGEWQDIDNRLESSGSEYSTGNARIKFAKKITGNETLFTLHDGNRKITMSLDGAIKKTAGQVTNTETEFDGNATKLQKLMTLGNLSSRIMYEDILDGVDLEYVVESLNVKENIIVKDRKDSYSYTFTVKLNNLEAELNEDGSVRIYDPDSEETVYMIPAPVVYDANMSYADSSDAFYTLTKTGGNEYKLTVTADADWMNASGRAFPVTVDPAVNVPRSSVVDLDISSSSPDRSSPSDISMVVSSTWRSYWKTTSLPALPESAYVINATISLKAARMGNNYVGVYQIVDEWDSTLTWNKTVNNDQGTFSSLVMDYVCVKSENADADDRFTWDITRVAKFWYNGTANHGIGFRIVDGTSSTGTSSFATSEHTTAANRPILMINYKDMKGTEPYWTFASQSAGNAGSGSVNLANGNLVFRKPLLSTTDSLMAYTPEIVYNSALAGTKYEYPNVQISYWGCAMPNGFKISIQETLIKKSFYDKTGSLKYFYIWADGDATEHYFMPVEGSSGKYKDEDGLQLTLDVTSTSAVITDSSGTKRNFTKLSGVPSSQVYEGWYMSSITDKNGNQVVFGFDNGPRPTSVSVKPNGSSSISFLTISYDSNYNPYIIWNQTTKQAIIFKYSQTPTGAISNTGSRYLRQIIYAHGNSSVTSSNWLNYYNNSTTTNITVDATVSYTYDSNGYLTKVKDELAEYEVRYTYTSGKVTAVQEYAYGVSEGQKITIQYYNGYTELRDSGSDDIYGNTDDIYTRYVFDAAGRVITTYSTDITRSEIYSVTSGEYEKDNVYANNNIKVSSAAGKTSANYILNGSFETSDLFPTYWFTSGNVDVTQTSPQGFGNNEAELTVSANSTSSIYQYVYLKPGDYTLSFDINTYASDDLTMKMTARSLSDSTRVFEKTIPYNRYYASGQTAFDFFTFTAEDIADSGEIFEIKISVSGGSSTESNTAVQVDNVMLSKSSGANMYNMVQNSDFEETSVYANGNTRYTPSFFWKLSSDSGDDASLTFTKFFEVFGETLRLSGELGQKIVAEQTVYKALASTLAEYANGEGGSSYPQVLNISGFGKTTSVMDGPDSKFALRLDVTYYINANQSETVTQYYNFCKDTIQWQYISGTFIIPANSFVKEIKVSCDYSGNDGYAYFDDISVTYESEGVTSMYDYYDDGKTKLSIVGNDVVFYSYESDGDLKEKITNNGRTVYTYDSYHRLLTEKYYTYSGILQYLADYDDMISALGTQTLEMSSSYEYNTYGLRTKSTVTAAGESESFITTTTYNVSSGSKIFGSIKTTIDSLGKTTRYFYDTNNGRLLANIQPDGKGTCYTYDSMGNLTFVQPAAYYSTYWDKINNSAFVEYTYNDQNLLESITTDGTEYNFTYNVFGNTVSASVGSTTIATQTYNSYNGKVNKVSYSDGTTVTYNYDKQGRVEKLTYSKGSSQMTYDYEYDSNGNLSMVTDNYLGRVTLYKYDSAGKMTNFIEYDKITLENLSSAWYTYDEQSRLSMVFYDQDYVYNSNNYYNSSSSLLYTYNENGSLNKYEIDSDGTVYRIVPNYDGHNRVDSKSISMGSLVNNITYEYKTNGTRGSVVISKYTSKMGSGAQKVYNYTYDNANANITKITDAQGNILREYIYDTLGRLTRENNQASDRTYIYTYDNNGNILSKKIYGYSEGSGTPSTTLYSTYNYTYGNSNWGDQLTSYRGQTISYDSVGNPTSYYNGSRMTMTWTGGNLMSVVNGGQTTSYTYNDSGIRTGKTAGGIEHRYLLDGSLILSEEYDGKLFLYMYDENGAPIGLKYRENSYGKDVFDVYLFEKNLQGDVIGIFREDGTQVVWYDYDAWGNRIDGAWVDNEKYEELFYANPFRYRGYYQDSETGFYYCGSRYYDPATGRFISADSTNILLNTPMSLTDKNLYSYCDNNPVMRVDNGGMFWDTVFDVVSLCASVVDVIKNPDDPWAWAGLAADVVSLAVPCVTGGGSLVRIIATSDDVIDLARTADKANDAIKTADKIVDGVKIQKATDFTEDAKKAIDALDHTGGVTKSTAAAGIRIHKGYKTGYNKLEGMIKEAKFGKNRMDFFDETHKIIYELKPNNPKSIAQGIRQLKRYDKAMGGGYTLILELY